MAKAFNIDVSELKIQASGSTELITALFTCNAYGHSIDNLKKREPLKIEDEQKYIQFLESILHNYPFLAIAGLRILTEIKLKELVATKTKDFNDKDDLGKLIEKLFKNNIIS